MNTIAFDRANSAPSSFDTSRSGFKEECQQENKGLGFDENIPYQSCFQPKA
jgi:hypothetical protein